jgi:hypothetical protein
MECAISPVVLQGKLDVAGFAALAADFETPQDMFAAVLTVCILTQHH